MCAPSYEYLDCGLKGCLYAVKQAQLGSRLQIMTMHSLRCLERPLLEDSIPENYLKPV